jgi:PadR family transcriptional regulator
VIFNLRSIIPPPRLSHILDLISEDNRLSIHAGELEVRPPGAPTTGSDYRGSGVRHSEAISPSGRCVDIRHQATVLSASDTMSRNPSIDLLQGTLDLLILRTLQRDPMHGWAISDRVQRLSEDVLQVGQGSLYPALHRLEHRGWIKAEWGVSELGRRARFYSLTAAGRKQLEVETADWARLSGAIARVLKLA